MSHASSPTGRTDSLDDVALRRLTDDAGIAGACRLLMPSRSASLALEVAHLLGYRMVASDRPGGTDADGWLDRHRRIVEIRRGLSPGAQMGLIAHSIRHVQQDGTAILSTFEDLSLDDRLSGTYLVEADADAFQVHVAAQLARAGSGGLWRHCVARNDIGSAADAYQRGYRKGGERTGAAMAFAALSKDVGFLDRYATVNADEIASGLATNGPGNLSGLATRLELASPAGMAYPDRGFRLAVRDFAGAAAERAEAAPRLVRNAA